MKVFIRLLPWMAIGGALGAAGRHLSMLWMNSQGSFLYSTLIVNCAGSLLIGILGGFFERRPISEQVRNFIFIGLLGSFTTFSTFSMETFRMLQSHHYLTAIVNVALHNVLGLILAFAGHYLISKATWNKPEDV